MPNNRTRLTDLQLEAVLVEHIETSIPPNQVITLSVLSVKELMNYCYELGRSRDLLKTTYKQEKKEES